MQGRLDDELGPDQVVLLGINEAGFEQDNARICNGVDLPWLQDTAEANVWGTWEHEYGDIVLLDRENRVVERVNIENQAQAEYEDRVWDALVSAATAE